MSADNTDDPARRSVNPAIAAAWIGVLGATLAAGIGLLGQDRGEDGTPPEAPLLNRIQGEWIGIDGEYRGARLTIAGPERSPTVTLCAPRCVDVGAGLIRAGRHGATFGFIDAASLEREVADLALENGRLVISVRGGSSEGTHAFAPF